ncbi:NAD(P)-binding protein [Aspergillus sclerotiicarbonarius CBS 121057]|uniref:NAD(P)-binding protein n=1 Tax=Aspergillus sclerotiicarbonarius (strain CBS 121057 / IBT 28362) TaxID=1448318 RepID=A0A319ECS5_ASPSB|nr:NAD(P)-binding protein [Aspergillus sclerotiicarbonarius CBS 121057]
MPSERALNFLIFGKYSLQYIHHEISLTFPGNGWISGQMQEILRSTGHQHTVSYVRIENREAVLSEITRVEPTHVINTAGARGNPNMDWCETHKQETIRSNIIGAANLADCCFLKGLHLTHFGSGCIYDYDKSHPWGGPGYTEEDEPNFTKSFYSYTKVTSEKILRHYPNVLILRVRNPIAADLHPKNMIVKLSQYEKIVNVPNSGSILPSLLPGALLLAENNETGVYNFANPGTFTHNEIMELLKKHVWPSLSWSNFSEEQRKILQAPRSNLKMDVTKLEKKLHQYGYDLPSSHEAMEEAFKKVKQLQEARG